MGGLHDPGWQPERLGFGFGVRYIGETPGTANIQPRVARLYANGCRATHYDLAGLKTRCAQGVLASASMHPICSHKVYVSECTNANCLYGLRPDCLSDSALQMVKHRSARKNC